MIYLFTGIPGSSKTLNVIKFVSEDKAFKDREIYYHRIKELQLPWIKLDEADVMAWDTLPDGSVLVVDEAQYLMPVRDPRKPLPDWILKMSEHRHKGLDLIFITQSPMLLDAGFRRFVGRHIHIERHFGLESAKWFQWEKCVSEVDDHFKRKEAVIKRVAFDKKYYGVYKSAEVHTHKRRIPLKVIIPFVGLAVLISLIWYLLSSFKNKASPNVESPFDPASVASQVIDPVKGFSVLNTEPAKKTFITTEEYIKQHQPRVADIPASAPIYDELTKPRAFPRPQCIKFNATVDEPEICKCFTQQATPLTISEVACNRYVKNGWFNHTKPDYSESSGSSAHASTLDQAQPRALARVQNVSVTR